jgi:iron complex outermembrane receptor protein
VENATAELLKSADSSIIKTSITDKTGLALFENVRFGQYLLRVTTVNSGAHLIHQFLIYRRSRMI